MKASIQILLVLIGFLATALPVQAQSWIWANSISDSDIQIGTSTAADPITGAVYLAGTFRGGLPSLSFTSAGLEDIVLARYQADGTFDWAIQVGSTSADFVTDIAVDSAGAVYMTGNFQGTVDFQGNGVSTSLTSSAGADVFLAKYDTLGRCVWAIAAGGPGSDLCNSVAIAGDKAYITGQYIFNMDFNSAATSIVALAGLDCFVAQYDTTGAFGWARTIGSSTADQGRALAADYGGVYVTGTYQGASAFIANTTIGFTLANSNVGTQEIFVTRMRESDGLATWAFPIGGIGDDFGHGIAVDNNQVYVVGEYRGFCQFSTAGFTFSNGGSDIFITAFAKGTGLGSWLRTYGTINNDEALDVTVRGTDVWVSGDYSGTLTMGSDMLPNVFFEDAFAARFTNTGTYTWSGYGGSMGTDLGKSISAAPTGVYVAGSYNNFTCNFFPSTALSVTNLGSTDIFLAKIEDVNFPPPVAMDDSVSILVNTSIHVDVMANDSNPGGATLTLTNACVPSNGTTSIVGDSILYTPAAAYVGIDSFCYTICDSLAQCSDAWVYVDVVDLPPDVNPPPNPLLLTTGSLVIAMDSVLQQDGGNLFNLYAYGLANALLKANIPLKWCIDSGKSLDGIDFSANATREFPSVQAVALRDFIGGPFVIDSTYSDTATVVINNYNGSVVNPVNVYRLQQDVVTDVRYILTHKPRVAIFTNGATQSIHVDYLTNAGFPVTDFDAILASAVSFDSVACYTFASDAGWASTDLNDTLETRRVRLFLEYGGNFLAQNDAIGTYEFLEGFQTTGGIQSAPFPAEVYQNPDMPYLQVHGQVANATGSYPAFVPEFGSAFLPGAYVLVRQSKLAHFKATARKIGLSSVGGECFYLGGQNYIFVNNRERNGRRMYLDAVLIPPRRPATCNRDFSCDVSVVKTILPGNYCVGDSIDYQIVVTNAGPGTAIGITVQDTLPAGLNYVSSAASQGSYNSATNTWTLGDIAYLQSDTLYIRAEIGSAGSFTNQAFVAASKHSPDFNPANDTSSVNFSSSVTPDPTITAVAAQCDNNSLVPLLAATGGGTWTGTGVSGNDFDPVSAGAGTFTVIYTVTTGLCTSVDSTSILVNASPLPNLGNDTILCQGDSLILNPGVVGSSYNWSTTETTPTIKVFTSSNYLVTVTDVNSCIGIDSALVTFVPLPLVDLGNDTTYCDGDSVTLSSSFPANSYLWSTAEITPTITVNSPGTYDLTVTDLNNCSAADTILVSLLPAPSIDLGNDTSACQGDPIVLSSLFAANSHLWNTTETTPTIQVFTSGAYDLEVTDGNNCTARDTINVTFTPGPSFTLGNDTILCQGDSVILDPMLAASGYAWNTSATTQQITVFTSGSYEVTLTDGNTCTGADTIDVTFLPAPTPNLGGPLSFCVGDSIVLDPNITATTYLWSTAETTPTITVKVAGMYYITVTNAAGCEGFDSVQVGELALPIVDASGNPQSLCEDAGALLLNATPAGGIFAGPGVSGDSLITIGIAPGLQSYTYSFTDGNGCSNADTFVIDILPLPQVSLGGLAGEYCVDDLDISLNLSPSGGVLTGPGTFPTGFSPLVAGPGGPYLLTYTYTDSNGCTSSANASTNVGDLPTPADAGPDQVLSGQNFTTLAANTPLNGSGSWSFLSGTASLAGFNDPNAALSNISAVQTQLIWTIDAGVCGTSADTVLILQNEIVIPTGFSPNGDQVNDLYVVRGIDRFEIRSLKVFNRWGNLVYSNDNYNNKWDGSDENGNSLADDTYYIVLDLGADGSHSQAVTIKR